ncbi:hypothetical protein B0H34DRAFT_189400 [Crassisporium funariophilum]|nr:hypothetical protein B0H34DRAFT_189400 [Crassisporium funariophilum]
MVMGCLEHGRLASRRPFSLRLARDSTSIRYHHLSNVAWFLKSNMGQRHQVYLIAKVVPHDKTPREARYRCIGALHHQECYGRLPLRATTRFMKLIKQKENAEIIREEINALHGLYGVFMQKPDLPAIPCPFAHFLLSSSWSGSYLDDRFDGGETIPLYANAATNLDNNDGSTVIEITDPEKPSYCFVSIRGLDMAERDDLPMRSPLSASQYVRAYYPKPVNISMNKRENAEEASVLATLQPFESSSLISSDMLAEAWPGEYEAKRPTKLAAPSSDLKSPAATVGVPSLADMAFRPALIHALQTGGVAQLEPLLWLPDRFTQIKQIIRTCETLSGDAIPLLIKIVNDERGETKTVDLANWSLTDDQIIAILSAQEGVEVLKLSHSKITIGGIRRLLPILPCLKRLVLMGTTITDDDVLALYSENPQLCNMIEAFIHPVFFKDVRQGAAPNAFSQITYVRYRSIAASIPYFTPAILVQILMDNFSMVMQDDGKIYPNYPPRAMCALSPLLAICASDHRRNGKLWAERSVPFVPQNSLRALRNREGWFLAYVPGKNPFDDHAYAFVRRNREFEFEQELEEKMKEVISGPSIAHTQAAATDIADAPAGLVGSCGDPLSAPVPKWLEDEKREWLEDQKRAKLKSITAEYADKMYELFDLQSFFQELAREGRPAPPADAYARLEELFAKLTTRERSPKLKMMTMCDFKDNVA